MGALLNRIWYFFLIVLIAGLLFYNHPSFGKEPFLLDDFLVSPEKYHNMEREFVGTVYNKTADYFYMNINSKQIKIIYPDVREPVFGELSVYGRADKAGFVEALEIHYRDYMTSMYFVSLIAFLIFLKIFFREWRLSKGGFAENA